MNRYIPLPRRADKLGNELCEMHYQLTAAYLTSDTPDWDEIQYLDSRIQMLEEGLAAIHEAYKLADSITTAVLADLKL